MSLRQNKETNFNNEKNYDFLIILSESYYDNFVTIETGFVRFGLPKVDSTYCACRDYSVNVFNIPSLVADEIFERNLMIPSNIFSLTLYDASAIIAVIQYNLNTLQL